MRKVLALVEGQTEERFVKDVLRPHLWPLGVHPEPKIATTKRSKHGPHFKGGITDFRKFEDDIRRLLGDTSAVVVTTMIDYYDLPHEFPGKQTLRGASTRERVIELEGALENHFSAGSRFIAYLMIHEFEALLFSSPDTLAGAMNAPSASRSRLQAIRDQFTTPEDINDNPQTKPSARVTTIFPDYRKGLHGPMTIGRIGLETVRRECPHFNEWISKLERFGSA